LPLRPRQRPPEVVVRLVASYRQDRRGLAPSHRRHAPLQRRRAFLFVLVAGGLAPLLAPANLPSLAEEELAARVRPQPVAENLLEERRQRNLPCRPLPAATLLLTNADRVGVEVDVGDLDAEQLAAPSPGVGGGAEEGVDPRVCCVLLDVRQQLLDLFL